MFSKQQTSKLPAWRELFQETKAMTVGAMLSHEDISRILRIPKREAQYFGQVQRWRREEMTARHRQWLTIPGKGYELQPPNQHRTVAAGHLARSRRASRRGLATLQHTDMEKLTDYERMLHINAEARTAVLYQVATATEKEVKYLPQSEPPKPLLEERTDTRKTPSLTSQQPPKPTYEASPPR